MQWEMTIECGNCGEQLEYECEVMRKGESWVVKITTGMCSCGAEAATHKALLSEKRKMLCTTCGTKLGSIRFSDYEVGDDVEALQCPYCQEDSWQGQCCGCQGEAARRREESI